MADESKSPLQVLKELITILNVDQNKCNSITLVRKALGKARDNMKNFEEWEKTYNNKVEEMIT